jgi:hypothetical protein
VPSADAQRVIQAMSNTNLRGRRVNVSIARPREDFDGHDGRRPRFGRNR